MAVYSCFLYFIKAKSVFDSNNFNNLNSPMSVFDIKEVKLPKIINVISQCPCSCDTIELIVSK